MQYAPAIRSGDGALEESRDERLVELLLSGVDGEDFFLKEADVQAHVKVTLLCVPFFPKGFLTA